MIIYTYTYIYISSSHGNRGSMGDPDVGFFQESETAEDLEDFVQWRRRQPKNSKQMVSAECEALVAAALEVTSGPGERGKNGLGEERRAHPVSRSKPWRLKKWLGPKSGWSIKSD